MIDEISIAGIATFYVQPEKLDALSQFNYLFGSNGTGKTTISRVIADEDSFPTCKVTWKGGTKLQSMVYNRDFVERKFLFYIVFSRFFNRFLEWRENIL